MLYFDRIGAPEGIDVNKTKASKECDICHYWYFLFFLLIFLNKGIVITKPDKGNGIVILDQKLFNNAIQEIISDTSKFEKLNEDPTLKRETSLQRLLHRLKKNFFNEN